MTLEGWVHENELSVEFLSPEILGTELGRMMLVKGDSEGYVFTEELNLIVTPTEEQLVLAGDIEYLLYEFGGNYFYTPISDIEIPKFNLFKWIGLADSEWHELGFPFLGVHGRYEALSGIGDYDDWCRKAKFLGYNTLGICESNTLAGSLPFQIACKKAGIKSIIGETFHLEVKDHQFRLKVYVMNDIGWQSLLRLHTYCAVHNDDPYLNRENLFGSGIGCIAVITPHIGIDSKLIEDLQSSFDEVYFQFDSTIYKSASLDKAHLIATKRMLTKRQLRPLLVWDAYCLDKSDMKVRNSLKKNTKVKDAHTTRNEYLKSIDIVFDELIGMFDSEEHFYEVMAESYEVAKAVATKANFEIDTSQFHLPIYEMTDHESEHFSNNEELFLAIIDNGLDKIDPDKYSEELLLDRITEEVSVIKKGKFIDYFLILWDIIQWCETEGILVGVGRGSAGGSLVSYCLGITKLNPLDYDLIFERFLNEGRITTSLPDIDTDFDSNRRDEVIRYMQDRYGHEYVCRLGTYGSLQLRGVIQEMARVTTSHSPGYINMVSSQINREGDWSDLFKTAVRKPFVKDFLIKNVDLVNSCRVALNTIKSNSIHACGTLIVPRMDKDGIPKTIYEWMPVRKVSDGTLISEWEGDSIEAAGFLKEDILSTKQMAKISNIFSLVQERYNITLDLEGIPLDDENVYSLFQQGYNKDVFHFGSDGLTKYSKAVHPENIEELIAMIALYRPGAMMSQAHDKFIKLKNGDLEVTYDEGLESVTKDTYGLYIYQEQLMRAARVLSGFTLVEADGLRKALGKKIPEKMASYKDRFIDGANEKGYSTEHALDVWEKVEAGASYSFNKSHAAAYAIIGYICNWLKLHYPLEFWTVAFQHGDEKNIPGYLTEVYETNLVKIAPPDINKSQTTFESDTVSKMIYWSINKIKGVGPVALECILGERKKNGKFFDMEEFLKRVDTSKVNKGTVESLIFAGAFDQMYGIEGHPRKRIKVLEDYYKARDDKKDGFDRNNYDLTGDLTWTIKERALSGNAMIPFSEALAKSALRNLAGIFGTPAEVLSDSNIGKRAMVGGIVVKIDEGSKERKRPTNITIDCNYETVVVKIFPNIWFLEGNKGIYGLSHRIKEGCLIFITGKVREKNAMYDENHYLQITGRFKNEVESECDIIDI